MRAPICTAGPFQTTDEPPPAPIAPARPAGGSTDAPLRSRHCGLEVGKQKPVALPDESRTGTGAPASPTAPPGTGAGQSPLQAVPVPGSKQVTSPDPLTPNGMITWLASIAAMAGPGCPASIVLSPSARSTLYGWPLHGENVVKLKQSSLFSAPLTPAPLTKSKASHLSPT